jgi:hypothetical protein
MSTVHSVLPGYFRNSFCSAQDIWEKKGLFYKTVKNNFNSTIYKWPKNVCAAAVSLAAAMHFLGDIVPLPIRVSISAAAILVSVQAPLSKNLKSMLEGKIRNLCRSSALLSAAAGLQTAFAITIFLGPVSGTIAGSIVSYKLAKHLIVEQPIMAGLLPLDEDPDWVKVSISV